MERLKLSSKAEAIASRLVCAKDSEKTGYIAAVDPQTGEVFYGKTVAEAAKEGRKLKNDPRAVFFFVKVGYPSVHVLKTVRQCQQRINKAAAKIITYDQKYHCDYETFKQSIQTNEDFLKRVEAQNPLWEEDAMEWDYWLEEHQTWHNRLKTIWHAG